jgi:HicA toxin of bacterial toxin-antitoxin,
MNSAHRKTLSALFAEPVNGTLEWKRIEALLLALGCSRVQGSGSSVTFERDGLKVFFHRPHPGKEALRYRVRDARTFLNALGVKA